MKSLRVVVRRAAGDVGPRGSAMGSYLEHSRRLYPAPRFFRPTPRRLDLPHHPPALAGFSTSAVLKASNDSSPEAWLTALYTMASRSRTLPGN